MLTEPSADIRCASRVREEAMQRLSRARMRGTMAATIGQRIRYIRKTELRMGRQKDFAALMGVAQSTVSRWETDDDTPDHEHVEKLARLSKKYDTAAKLRYGEWQGINAARPTPLVLAERILAAEREGLVDPTVFAVRFLEMLQTKPREAAVPVEDAGLEEIVPKGGLALVDLDDRDLEDGAPCLAEVDDRPVLRVYRSAGGVIRFEPRTRQRGIDPIYPRRGYRILGRIIRVVSDAPRTMI